MMSSKQTTLPKRSFTIAKHNNFDNGNEKIWCAEITGYHSKFIFERRFVKPSSENEHVATYHLKENVPYHSKSAFGEAEYFMLPTNGKKKRMLINQVKAWLDGQGIKSEQKPEVKRSKISYIFGKENVTA
jgi:hypothetical protein